MSDFTPTTEQVRDGYRYDTEDEYRDPIGAPQRSAEAGRAFDRWLEAHDAELRERIARELVDEAQAMTRSSTHLLGGSSEKNATYRTGICDGLTGAARIARGEQP